MPGNRDDRQLVIDLRNGDKTAFGEIFRKYREKVYYFAVRYYNAPEDAENVVQDVFVKIWEERDNIKENLSLNNYIYTITKNHLFNLHRKKINEKAYRDYIIHHLTQVTNLENDLIFSDLKEKIDAIIETLPAQRKKVFILANIKGLSNKEVASELNLSVRTVEVHRSLAMQTLKKILKKTFQ